MRKVISKVRFAGEYMIEDIIEKPSAKVVKESKNAVVKNIRGGVTGAYDKCFDCDGITYTIKEYAK